MDRCDFWVSYEDTFFPSFTPAKRRWVIETAMARFFFMRDLAKDTADREFAS